MADSSIPPDPDGGADLDAVLDRITALKAEQKAIEAALTPLLEQLSGALEAVSWMRTSPTTIAASAGQPGGSATSTPSRCNSRSRP